MCFLRASSRWSFCEVQQVARCWCTLSTGFIKLGGNLGNSHMRPLKARWSIKAEAVMVFYAGWSAQGS